MSRIAIVLFAVAGGCSADPEDSLPDPQSRCTELRDHIVELRLADAAHVDRAAHAETMRAVLGDSFMSYCAKDLRDSQVECALHATDSAALTACAKGSL